MDDQAERDRRSDQADGSLHEAACRTGSPKAITADTAADEYAERHHERFAERINEAGLALLNGKAATLAYVLGISEKDVERLGGVPDGRDTTSRSANDDLKPGDKRRTSVGQQCRCEARVRDGHAFPA